MTTYLHRLRDIIRTEVRHMLARSKANANVGYGIVYYEEGLRAVSKKGPIMAFAAAEHHPILVHTVERIISQSSAPNALTKNALV